MKKDMLENHRGGSYVVRNLSNYNYRGPDEEGHA